MKITGHDLTEKYVETLVIPRATTNIVIRAQAILGFKEFEELLPSPTPREGTRKNKVTGIMEKFLDVEDSKYQVALLDWANKRTTWMILKSLEATEGLEWETVKMNEPDTWENYAQELIDAGFSDMEVGKMINCVTTVCGLNEEKITEATNSFLVGAVEETAKQLSTQSSAPLNTESGEPAKG